MESEFEKHEMVSVDSGVMTKDQLAELIYKNQSLPQDRRFLPFNEGGVFKYFWLSDLTQIYEDADLAFPYIKEDGVVVALAKLMKGSKGKNTLAISFVSVDPKYQGKGYASKLYDEIFRYAKEKNMSVASTPYSDDGHRQLKTLGSRYAEKYGVNYIPNEEIK